MHIRPVWTRIHGEIERNITHVMEVPGGVIVRFTEFNGEGQPSSVSMVHVPFVELVEVDGEIAFKSSMEDMATQMATTMKRTIEDSVPQNPPKDRKDFGKS